MKPCKKNACQDYPGMELHQQVRKLHKVKVNISIHNDEPEYEVQSS